MGRFFTLDPIEMLHRYAYASGNPINQVDPSGLFDWNNRRIEQGDWLWCIAREAYGTSGISGSECSTEDHQYITSWVDTMVRIHNEYVGAGDVRDDPDGKSYHRINDPNHITPGTNLWLMCPEPYANPPRCSCSRSGNNCSCRRPQNQNVPQIPCPGDIPDTRPPAQPPTPTNPLWPGGHQPQEPACRQYFNEINRLQNPHHVANWQFSDWINMFNCDQTGEIWFPMKCGIYAPTPAEIEAIVLSIIGLLTAVPTPITLLFGWTADILSIVYNLVDLINSGGILSWASFLSAVAGLVPDIGDAIALAGIIASVVVTYVRTCHIDWYYRVPPLPQSSQRAPALAF
jgi:hypothetical protein